MNIFKCFLYILVIICLITSIYISCKQNPDYSEANFYLLLAVFNYISCININKNAQTK